MMQIRGTCSGDERSYRGAKARRVLGRRSTMALPRGIWGVIVIPALLDGCQAPQRVPADYALRHVAAADREAALSALEAAMVARGLDIERRDDTAGSVRAVPRDTSSAALGPGERRLSSYREQRTVVEARVLESAAGMDLACRARVERLVTQAYRLATEGRRSDDRPGVTPIEQEAATTNQQNAVWQAVRRDRMLEQAILESASRRLGDVAAP